MEVLRHKGSLCPPKRKHPCICPEPWPEASHDWTRMGQLARLLYPLDRVEPLPVGQA
jgi:hypothetical protein